MINECIVDEEKYVANQMVFTITNAVKYMPSNKFEQYERLLLITNDQSSENDGSACSEVE